MRGSDGFSRAQRVAARGGARQRLRGRLGVLRHPRRLSNRLGLGDDRVHPLGHAAVSFVDRIPFGGVGRGGRLGVVGARG